MVKRVELTPEKIKAIFEKKKVTSINAKKVVLEELLMNTQIIKGEKIDLFVKGITTIGSIMPYLQNMETKTEEVDEFD